jgi:pimeloyl-ACP methyl ester carboxylesterase
VELVWESPTARFLRPLASLGRLLHFDKRGTGMSDRVVGVPTLETRMDDIRAVMDAAAENDAPRRPLGSRVSGVGFSVGFGMCGVSAGV